MLLIHLALNLFIGDMDLVMLTKHLYALNKFLLFLMVFFFHCSLVFASSSNRGFMELQRDTTNALDNYLKTHETKWRRIVTDSKGLSEIQASRIYRAFHVYLTGAPYDDKKQWKKEIEELYRNPQITLSVLRPLVEEQVNDELDDEGYNGMGGDIIIVFLNLCQNVAEIETDGFAYSILQSLSDNSDIRIVNKVRKVMEHLALNNWRVKTDSYNLNKDCFSLKWLVDNYFSKRSVTQLDIKNLLGVGVEIQNNVWCYKGKGGTVYDSCSNPSFVKDKYYVFYFRDSILFKIDETKKIPKKNEIKW